MKNYKTYTWDELKDFVNSQKDDRLVNCQDCSVDDIGDVLVHFGRKKTKKPINSVGMSVIDYGKGRTMKPDNADSTNKVVEMTRTLCDRNPSNYLGVKAIVNKIK